MIGQVLGDRYQLQQQLGKKPGRQTFLARDLVTQEFVVVKILKFGSDFEWDHLKLFEREAQILQTLGHPKIPKYLNGFDLDLPDCKGFALVQTYIKASSLEDHLNAGRTFSEAEVKQIAENLLEILIYLHSQKPHIIHRDIKPSNILLTNRSGNSAGQVYLVDFGSVQNLAAVEGGTFTIVGTYGYMPPEQFGGRAVPASDLYSLGATLIYLMTRLHPSDLPQKDFRIQFEQVTELSLGFSRWLRKMMEPSLERRFSSAEVALQALKRSDFIDYYAPMVSRKPAFSNVLLTKNAEELEILTNSDLSFFTLLESFFETLYGCSMFFMLLFAFYAWVLQPLIAILSTVSPLIYWSVTSSLLLTTAYWIVMRFICVLFEQTKLVINQDEIYSDTKIFGWKFTNVPPSSRNDIIKIERIYPYKQEEKNSEGETYYTKVPGAILIWTRDQKYELSNLTPRELDWLGYELSEWLELPIETRQMPIVKPNN